MAGYEVGEPEVLRTDISVFFSDKQNLHNPNIYFTWGDLREAQEVSERAKRILDGVRMLSIPVLEPNDHGLEPIQKVHTSEYLDFLPTAYKRWHELPHETSDEVMRHIFRSFPKHNKSIVADSSRYQSDGSCPIGENTWESAYWSAQSAISASDVLLKGGKMAYALCRPPGHHATPNTAGGFCYLNNAAIAARHLQQQPGFRRIAILDTDMHHGNGVQDTFYKDGEVLYVSIHGDPNNFYPLTSGYEEEKGEGPGLGKNINLPMPHGSPEGLFFELLQDAIKAIGEHEADALVLAHGYDIYERDPQAKVAVTTEGFNWLGRAIADVALPTVVVQEGGYHLDSLARNTKAFLTGLTAQAA